MSRGRSNQDPLSASVLGPAGRARETSLPRADRTEQEVARIQTLHVCSVLNLLGASATGPLGVRMCGGVGFSLMIAS